jgi:hypothetical protein
MCCIVNLIVSYTQIVLRCFFSSIIFFGKSDCKICSWFGKIWITFVQKKRWLEWICCACYGRWCGKEDVLLRPIASPCHIVFIATSWFWVSYAFDWIQQCQFLVLFHSKFGTMVVSYGSNHCPCYLHFFVAYIMN